MTQQPQKKRSAKKQSQIDLTQGPDLSDLDQFTEITPADVNAATALWDSKTKLSGLLSAKVPEPGEEQ